MNTRNTKYHLTGLLLMILLWQCTEPRRRPEVVGLDHLQKLISARGEDVQVINFWATWCAPCVKEMPLFEALANGRDDVHVTLVSLDLYLDPNAEKVRQFVREKNIHSDVLILDAGNPNEWIDKVDSNWSGALPATLIVNSRTGKRVLVEKELHQGDLENLIKQVQ